VVEQVLTSKALRREVHFRVYLPAPFRTMVRYPLMIVYDGADHLHYTAARTVLDNLIHRGEVAEIVMAFISPGNRLVEYANHAPHARFVARELTPYLPTPTRSCRPPAGAHRWGRASAGWRRFPPWPTTPACSDTEVRYIESRDGHNWEN
jgi:enterochelin esterase family protein